jgi:hypothetical protein
MKSDISLTKQKDFFKNIEENVVFLLNKESSNDFWIKNIDEKDNNFFRLQDDSFIIKNQKFLINIDFDGIELIEKLNIFFTSTLFWNKNDVIYFCANKDYIIETKLEFLVKYFDDFFSFSNECPIIYNFSTANQFLYYTYHGDFYLTTR